MRLIGRNLDSTRPPRGCNCGRKCAGAAPSGVHSQHSVYVRSPWKLRTRREILLLVRRAVHTQHVPHPTQRRKRPHRWRGVAVRGRSVVEIIKTGWVNSRRGRASGLDYIFVAAEKYMRALVCGAARRIKTPCARKVVISRWPRTRRGRGAGQFTDVTKQYVRHDVANCVHVDVFPPPSNSSRPFLVHSAARIFGSSRRDRARRNAVLLTLVVDELASPGPGPGPTPTRLL